MLDLRERERRIARDTGQRILPYIDPAWFGLALAAFNQALLSGNRRRIEKQRRRLQRMRWKYTTHPDVIAYVERSLENVP